jgi:hypothetical protein
VEVTGELGRQRQLMPRKFDHPKVLVTDGLPITRSCGYLCGGVRSAGNKSTYSFK